MGNKNFYESFDKDTEVKLSLLSDYFEKWFPVFLFQDYISKIRIIDFFCGKGKDDKGGFGSPLRILKVLEEFLERHGELASSKEIRVIFNDKEKSHIKSLRGNISEESFSEKLNECVEFRAMEFKNLFGQLKAELREADSASFIFLDQYGVKEVTDEIFKELFSLKNTDFMFFISSSSIKRFIKQDEFKSMWWMSKEKIKSSPIPKIHNTIVKEYKKLAPKNAHVIPFTIKKGTNVYGLVFCSKSLLAADKFLKVAWEINPTNGNANFDINEDEFHQLGFFENNLKKTDAFAEFLKDKIVNKKILDNIATYKYIIENGFLPKHVRSVLKELKDEGIISYKGQFSLSYSSCIRKNKRIEFIFN